jgi:hypothetical protein
VLGLGSKVGEAAAEGERVGEGEAVTASAVTAGACVGTRSRASEWLAETDTGSFLPEGVMGPVVLLQAVITVIIPMQHAKVRTEIRLMIIPPFACMVHRADIRQSPLKFLVRLRT